MRSGAGDDGTAMAMKMHFKRTLHLTSCNDRRFLRRTSTLFETNMGMTGTGELISTESWRKSGLK
jgi:hypothetical protein